MSSKFFRLCPFIDEDKLIRVGGRLKNPTALGVYQRHPFVLPANFHFRDYYLKMNMSDACMGAFEQHYVQYVQNTGH